MKPHQRLQFAIEKKLCQNCLKPNHTNVECRSPRRCDIDGCGEKHTKFLHQISTQSTAASSTESSGTNATNAYCNKTTNKRIALPIVAVTVKANGKELRTNALLDSGSTATFCTEELIQKLQANYREDKITLTTLQQKQKPLNVKVTSLKVSDTNNNNTITLPTVIARNELPVNRENVPTYDDINLFRWPHLKNVTIPPSNLQDVHLLIGQDVPQALLPIEVKAGREGQPYATKTLLGWTLNGPLNGETINVTNHYIQAAQHDVLEEKLEAFWKMDSPVEEKGMSVNDVNVQKMWEDRITFEEGHFTLPIPFKDDVTKLAQNKPQAERRLRSLKTRLDKNEDLKIRYSKEIDELLKKGHARLMGKDEQPQWFIPHHHVLNTHKPDKVRIVFDCSARYQEMSLNQAVFSGPDLANSLVGVLLRFRLNDIAVLSDVKEMFHQVKVPIEQQCYLAFLWWPGGDFTRQPLTYCLTVHLFGGTWCPSASTYALRQSIQHFGQNHSKEAKDAIENNFYIDDYLKTFGSAEEAIQVSKEVEDLLHKGGFKVTKWLSNNKDVLQKWPEEERAPKTKEMKFDDSVCERALGVYWNIENDTLSFKVANLEKPLTKRGILSMTSSIFDPLGYISPVIIQAKGIIQEMCRAKLPWDADVPEEVKTKWLTWQSNLEHLRDVALKRSLDVVSAKSIQLHHFCDASEFGFGVVTYIRTVNDKGKVTSSILMSKSRLAPIKKTTIPRLELSGAALAVKQDVQLRKELSKEIHLQESVFWTDSTIVLSYINNMDKRFHTFVAN